jgi:hypothetical protein
MIRRSSVVIAIFTALLRNGAKPSLSAALLAAVPPFPFLCALANDLSRWTVPATRNGAKGERGTAVWHVGDDLPTGFPGLFRPWRAGSGLAEGIAAVTIEGSERSKTKAGNVCDELWMDVKADPREDEA